MTRRRDPKPRFVRFVRFVRDLRSADWFSRALPTVRAYVTGLDFSVARSSLLAGRKHTLGYSLGPFAAHSGKSIAMSTCNRLCGKQIDFVRTQKRDSVSRYDENRNVCPLRLFQSRCCSYPCYGPNDRPQATGKQ